MNLLLFLLRSLPTPVLNYSQMEIMTGKATLIGRNTGETQMPKLQAKARMRMSKAIRYKCLDCVAGQEGEVRNCDILDCSLWEFRFGKNPTPEMAAAAKDIKVLGRDRELWEPKRRVIQLVRALRLSS